MHLGLEIAAYSTMVNWNPCTCLLFSRAQAILCGYLLQIGKQFLSGPLHYRGGECFSHAVFAFRFTVFFSVGWLTKLVNLLSSD